MRRPMVHTLLLVTFLTSAPALAGQQAQDAQAPARGRAGRAAADGLSPVEVVNMLDAYAMLQAQNALQLSDEQVPGRSSPGSSGCTRRGVRRSRSAIV